MNKGRVYRATLSLSWRIRNRFRIRSRNVIYSRIRTRNTAVFWLLFTKFITDPDSNPGPQRLFRISIWPKVSVPYGSADTVPITSRLFYLRAVLVRLNRIQTIVVFVVPCLLQGVDEPVFHSKKPWPAQQNGLLQVLPVWIRIPFSIRFVWFLGLCKIDIILNFLCHKLEKML